MLGPKQPYHKKHIPEKAGQQSTKDHSANYWGAQYRSVTAGRISVIHVFSPILSIIMLKFRIVSNKTNFAYPNWKLITREWLKFLSNAASSVGCLCHSHGKNPVRLYPKLQIQPIGLPKIFIDYLFFQANQSDCRKSVSILNRFAFSEERWNQNVPCQICRAWVFPLVVL